MDLQRYQRQMLLPQLGQAGQARLGGSRAVIVGCGALGSVIAEQLARAGVGHLRLVDRDIVELSNLHRQVLFDEADASAGLPKAIAAAERLRRVNGLITVEPLAVDLHAGNVEELTAGVDLILDGTDNVETRYLLNDAAVKHAIPWIYGACVGSEGRVMAIQPGEGPCLRCLFPAAPKGSDLPTCDTAGVLGPVASVVASLQALAAIKLLSGNTAAVSKQLLVLDLWNDRMRAVDVSGARRSDCPACGKGQFDFLDAPAPAGGAGLCGRNAVQVRPAGRVDLSLPAVAERLRPVAEVDLRPYFVRAIVDGIRLTIFPDGRMIADGTKDIARARSLYARYVGA
jgi:molybdopterin-synthase adenylyltransferase